MKQYLILFLVLIIILCSMNNNIEKFETKIINEINLQTPKIIHQTWKNYDLPENYNRWSKRCKKFHKDFKYILWSDEDNLNFIKKEYPWFLKTYNSYDKNIKRVDAVRYFYLYHYGGIYMDMDFECLKNLTPLLNNKAIFGYQDKNNSIANAFMISPPKHPLFKKIIYSLDKYKDLYVLDATGPGLLTKMINNYDGNDIKVLEMPLIYTHSWDQKDNICEDKKIQECIDKFPDSYTTTYWTASWQNE
jgi:mannosyltransferase OCH1-like enzyme